MNRAPQPNPRLPAFEWVLIGIFLFLLWAPTMDKLFSLDRAPTIRENRLLARNPGFSEMKFGQMQKFLASSEASFNDHFGFRKQLIFWFQDWKLLLYHERSLYQTVTGPHQWQFFGEMQMVEHHLGWLKFTPSQLQAWQVLLEKRRDWLAKQDIQYLFVIPPDKQTIYSEELPRWLIDAPPVQRETKLDQFLKYMKEHSTVAILDLRQPLLAAKKIAPTYLEHDTHWNMFGGFVACQEVIQSLGKFPDLPPLRLEDFYWTNRPASGGDLGSGAKEGNFYEFYPKPNLPAFSQRDATDLVCSWDFHKSAFITETEGSLNRTAVIFHDSFGMAWRKFLGHDFKRIVFMPDNREFNPAVITANKPDVVINEIVERFLNTLDPDELMARDALP